MRIFFWFFFFFEMIIIYARRFFNTYGICLIFVCLIIWNLNNTYRWFNINSIFFAANLAFVMHYIRLVFLLRDLCMYFAKVINVFKKMQNSFDNCSQFSKRFSNFFNFQYIRICILHILHVSLLDYWLWCWRWFSQWLRYSWDLELIEFVCCCNCHFTDFVINA